MHVPEVTWSVTKKKTDCKAGTTAKGQDYWPIFQLAGLVFFGARATIKNKYVNNVVGNISDKLNFLYHIKHK